ncbi:iron-siderophore ABC transporter substrate-binding protein [Corynebacterium pacaense]|uniref:iron-siderophore ABC transporter substrate-binding protein n=1 Tax=Corynebacterium pacaense TaxID=1816684 RepID=UPI0009BC3013|nr:iron-siderophore ABC transporter substrate-binding protein [Corynebacterium pacaense]
MRRNRIFAGLLAASLSVSLAACSSDEGTSTSASTSGTSAASSSEAFPVTIEHAFGSTTIESAPQRVATVAWSNHEVPLALGITPVGMERATWGDDDNDGVLPWVREKLDELGGEEPVLFDATDSLPFEEIANTRPDVILAAYSGMTREDYDQLSQIAPVVAYPELAWGTTLDQTIEMNSRALGKEAEGQALIDQINSDIATAMDNHPALRGSTPVFAFFDANDLSQVGVYTAVDPRVRFLLDSGFNEAEVLKSSGGSESFYEQLSAENPEQFDDVDFIITYGSDDEATNRATLEALQADPLLSRIPAIAEGRIVFLGDGPLAASATPSPLSIPWGVEDYFAKLEEALK